MHTSFRFGRAGVACLAALCAFVVDTASADDPPAESTVRIAALVIRDSARAEIAAPSAVEKIEGLLASIESSCVVPEHARDPRASGVLAVRFSVNRVGRLVGLQLTRRDGTSAWLASCVRGVMRASLDFASLATSTGGRPDAALPLRIEMELWVMRSPDASPDPDAPASCTSPDPSGCRSSGCGGGMRCDLHARCVPSSCSCQPESNVWMCTTDCGGGVCVPAR